MNFYIVRIDSNIISKLQVRKVIDGVIDPDNNITTILYLQRNNYSGLLLHSLTSGMSEYIVMDGVNNLWRSDWFHMFNNPTSPTHKEFFKVYNESVEVNKMSVSLFMRAYTL